MKTYRQHRQSQSTFAGNSALLHSGVIDFVILPAQRFLAGNSFIS